MNTYIPKADVGARMARAHASLAGLKSMSTTIAAEGIEDCRRCCGGHGYLVRGFSRRRWRRYRGFAHTQGDGYLFVGSFVVFIHLSIHCFPGVLGPPRAERELPPAGHRRGASHRLPFLSPAPCITTTHTIRPPPTTPLPFPCTIPV